MFKLLQRLFKYNTDSFYRKDQMGILARYLREKDNWDLHLNNTKHYILNYFNENNPTNIMVIGSGWLLDFPEVILVNTEVNVILCDISHPAQIVNKYKNSKNIHFKRMDATGGLLKLAENSNTISEFITQLSGFKNNLDFTQYNMVVSLNVLNQLDILLVEYLETKFEVNDEYKQKIKQIVQEQHLSILPKGSSVLITDYIEKSITNTGVVADKGLVNTDLGIYSNIKKWNWVFDTHKRYRSGVNTTMEVIAISK